KAFSALSCRRGEASTAQAQRRSGGRWRMLPPNSPGCLGRTVNAHIGMPLAEQVVSMQTTHHAAIAIQQVLAIGVEMLELAVDGVERQGTDLDADRKSTRLNSSH